MDDFFKTVWSDIKKRRNLELYIILAVAMVILVADIFGLETSSALFEIVLAALAVLIYGLIESRHTNERVEQQLETIGHSIREQQDKEITATEFFLTETPLSNDTFSSANTIFLLGYSLSRTIREHHFVLGQRLVAGAHIRVIILDPENDSLLQMAALESVATTAELWRNNLQVTRASVNSLAQHPNKSGKIEIGYLPYSPSFGMVMIEPYEPQGFSFVDIYHHKTTAPNATFKLSASKDAFWYNFFREQFEILWQSCKVEELPEKTVILTQSTC